jgi:aspartokinase-like uncharacterized kinase
MRTAVWKVGGSLFDLPDLALRLARLLANPPQTHVLLVPGGGRVADVVREWQRLHGGTDEAAHWQALRAMELSAHLLAGLLPNGQVVTTRDEAETCQQRGMQPVLSVTPFAQVEEQHDPASALPHDWTVTSDSLAVWIAARWPAEECVLLKSCALENGVSAEIAATSGFVDAHFPRLAPAVNRIGWCNLRAPLPTIQPWLTNGISL